MQYRLDSDGNELVAYFAKPPNARKGRVPGLVMCHGFPSGGAGGPEATSSAYLTLADRIANDLGWAVLAVNYRGCGGSEGDFSISGWLADTNAAVAEVLSQPEVGGVWLAGFGTGGALSITAAANDERIRGVAAVAPPADFADWCRNPRRLLLHARRIGVISSEGTAEDFAEWAAEFLEFRAVDAAPRLAPRPLLLLHGSDDEAVPVFDARVLADAHGSADLRIIGGAGHALRYDPRAVAVLLGWLERQRNRTVL